MTSPEGGYSDAFSKFVTAENDLAGALAYAFYKQQKREFIVRNNLPFDHERVRQYHCDLNGTRIAQLREFAEMKLAEYTEIVADQTTEELRAEVAEGFVIDELNKHDQRLEDLLQLTKTTNENVLSGTRWWKSLLAGVAASFVFGLVLTWAKVIDWTNPLTSKPPAQETSPPKAG